MNGVEVFVVDRRGKGRLKPQSPRTSEDWGVVIERWIGCGRVAVSELKTAVEERSPAGRGSGGGMEKILDARRRAPPGDTLRDAITASFFLGVDFTPLRPVEEEVGQISSSDAVPCRAHLCFCPIHLVHLQCQSPFTLELLGQQLCD